MKLLLQLYNLIFKTDHNVLCLHQFLFLHLSILLGDAQLAIGAMMVCLMHHAAYARTYHLLSHLFYEGVGLVFNYGLRISKLLKAQLKPFG